MNDLVVRDDFSGVGLVARDGSPLFQAIILANYSPPTAQKTGEAIRTMIVPGW